MMIERKDEYKIHSYDTDMKGKLSLPVLTRFLQETAWLNAEDMNLGYQKFLKSKMGWVLFKQYMEVNEWPLWGDSIAIKTWPSCSDKLFCYREFEIFENDKLLARISSSWLVIDLNRRKPLRTSKYYTENQNINRRILFPELIKSKMKSVPKKEKTAKITVNLSDIDVNDHVNNSCYSAWCLNFYQPDFYKQHEIVKIEQQFAAEARLGDKLEIHTEQMEDLVFIHCIKRNGKDVFILKLSWK